MRINILLVITLCSVTFYTKDSLAHIDVVEHQDEYLRSRFSLGVGSAIVRFDTNFKFTEKGSPVGIFIDGEGTLGLPETDSVPIFFGNFRVAKRHWLGFSYFQVKREVIWFQLDESKDFNLGDLTITAGANASITLSDKTRFYYLSYNYALFDDSRTIILLTLGLYGLDLKYVLEAKGEITLNGYPVIGDSLTREASVFAPLPLLGINAWYNITPKWALGTKISVVGGTYEDVTAVLLDTVIRAKYQFTKHMGGSFGIAYFNGEVEIDEADQLTEVDYGFDGLALGLHFNF